MPLSADDRVFLIRIKIERAKKHLLDLEREVILLRGKQVHVVFTDKKLAPGKIGLPDLTPVRVLSFNALSAAGDVIQNLRSALDHLAHHLVAVAGNTPSRLVEFPIGKDAATYEADKVRKVQGMRPEAVEAIDRLKPYKGGNELLWKIHALNNLDKHRAIFTLDRNCIMQDEWLPPNGFAVRTSDPTFATVFDDEIDKDVNLEIYEAVNEPQIPQGDALLPSLHQMVNFVEGLVESFRNELA